MLLDSKPFKMILISDHNLIVRKSNYRVPREILIIELSILFCSQQVVPLSLYE